MSWVGRFGNRPHGIVTQDELFSLIAMATALGRKCTLCEGATVGVIHCNDCGWTSRMCDAHRPKVAEVEHVKKLHAVLCQPVMGSN